MAHKLNAAAAEERHFSQRKSDVSASSSAMQGAFGRTVDKDAPGGVPAHEFEAAEVPRQPASAMGFTRTSSCEDKQLPRTRSGEGDRQTAKEHAEACLDAEMQGLDIVRPTLAAGPYSAGAGAGAGEDGTGYTERGASLPEYPGGLHLSLPASIPPCSRASDVLHEPALQASTNGQGGSHFDFNELEDDVVLSIFSHLSLADRVRR